MLFLFFYSLLLTKWSPNLKSDFSFGDFEIPSKKARLSKEPCLNGSALGKRNILSEKRI